jgi:mycothiol synthase
MTSLSSTRITNRPLQGDADAMRLRQLLIDSYATMGREFNWETRRWEGSYWTVTDTERANPSWGAHTQVWETSQGHIIGAVVPESPGDIALQIHPDYRTLEGEMIVWAEEHLAISNDSGKRELKIWAFDWDTERKEQLTKRGFTPQDDQTYCHRRRVVSDPIPDIDLAEGYILRSVQDTDSDVQNWVNCSNNTFGQSYNYDLHPNFQHYSPSHNYDLHVIAEAPDGTFAAFAGLTVDEVNRYATFEPVGTHSNHRRKGLARAIMYEGIRRLQTLGTADIVYVANWGTADAGLFYADMGMEHYATNRAWRKVL